MTEKILGISSQELYKIIISKSFHLLLAIGIVVGGFWFAKLVAKGIRKAMQKGDLDAGLISFISSLVAAILKVLVVITAMTQLGLEMTSFVAILGAAGLAIGMAFSGTLSNFAGGIMILIFKPFKVGDLILAQGENGTVKEIQIFNTFLSTGDNKIVILPNGPLANGTIVNFTKADTRRVDFSFNIATGDDYEKAKNMILKFIHEDQRILQEPAAFVGIGAITNTAAAITVRTWTNVGDYWGVFFEMNERVYKEFTKEGLHLPTASIASPPINSIQK